MANDNVLDRMDEIKSRLNGDAEDFIIEEWDINNSYVMDEFWEYADDACPIYYSQIFDFIRDYTGDVEDAINEFGWDGVGRSIFKAGQMGWINATVGQLEEDQDDIVAYCCLKYYNEHYGEDLDDDQLDEIENLCVDNDKPNFQNIIDTVVL